MQLPRRIKNKYDEKKDKKKRNNMVLKSIFQLTSKGMDASQTPGKKIQNR